MEVCGDAKSGTRNSDAPNIGAEYEIAIFDRDGNEKRRFGGKANCFVKGFLDYIWHLMANSTSESTYGGYTPNGARVSTSFRDIGGTARSALLDHTTSLYNPHVGGARINGGSDSIATGIVCGRGSADTTILDYAVGGAIGTSELSYGNTVVEPLKFDGAVATLRLSRPVLAVSSTPVEDIRSIAVYAKGSMVNWSFMIIRDVIPRVDLNPGESMVIIYKFIFNGSS